MFRHREKFDEQSWGEHGPNFVFFGVPGERELLDLEAAIGPDGVSFREPDMGDRLTAIAYMGTTLPAFDQLQLL